jgi:hypothetical protein
MLTNKFEDPRLEVLVGNWGCCEIELCTYLSVSVPSRVPAPTYTMIQKMTVLQIFER